MIKEETEILHEKDEFMYKLYFHAIRRYVDYSTGIVGLKRGISWESLADEMYVTPRPGGRRNGKPHKSALRRSLWQLEKIGLIKTLSKGKRLIFELPVIVKDIQMRKKADSNSTRQYDMEDETTLYGTNPDGIVFSEIPITQADTETDNSVSRQTDTPHIVILKPKNIEAIVHSRFDEFWDVYPRKENKKKAAKLWERKGFDSKADLIINDVKTRKVRHEPWQDKQFIPHATTYLNGERWEDELREIPYEQQSRKQSTQISRTSSASIALDNILNSPTRSKH